jgi:hypothetical protein
MIKLGDKFKLNDGGEAKVIGYNGCRKIKVIINEDKDLKIYGNKIYGPDACVFVPQKINNFFHKSSNILPIGVNKCDSGYYSAINLTRFKKLLENYFEQFLNDHYVENPDEI